MQKAKTLQLTKIKNLRYRQLKVENDYYLVDLDASKLMWLCPTLYWKFPIIVQKIDKPIENIKSSKNSFITPGLLAPLLTVLLHHSIPKHIFTDSHIANAGASLLIFLILQFILLGVRYIISWRLEMPNQAVKQRAKLTFSKPSEQLYYQKRGLGTLIVVGLIMIIFDVYLVKGNLVGLFCLVCLSIIYYCSHLIAEAPDDLEGFEIL